MASPGAEREREGGTLSVGGFDPDPSAMPFDNFLDDRKADAGSTAELVACVESLEDPEDRLEMFLEDADAVISDCEHDGRQLRARWGGGALLWLRIGFGVPAD